MSSIPQPPDGPEGEETVKCDGRMMVKQSLLKVRPAAAARPCGSLRHNLHSGIGPGPSESCGLLRFNPLNLAAYCGALRLVCGYCGLFASLRAAPNPAQPGVESRWLLSAGTTYCGLLRLIVVSSMRLRIRGAAPDVRERRSAGFGAVCVCVCVCVYVLVCMRACVIACVSAFMLACAKGEGKEGVRDERG